MKTIVFVCSGNTCRSPMAEGMFRVLLQQHGITDVAVTSCGTAAFPGMMPTRNAVRAAEAYGADISAHRTRPLTPELLQQGDLFVCMTELHRAQLLGYLPENKLRALSPGVEDPYGGDAQQYNACAAQIWEGLQSLIKEC